MYQSPIQFYVEDFRQKMIQEAEQTILQCIHDVGITVNKEELIQALNYDRNQYEKGYADAKAEVGPEKREAQASKYIRQKLVLLELDRWKGYLDEDMLFRIKFSMERLPGANVVPAPQWHFVSDPPKKSGRYLVACNQWGGNMRRCVDYLQTVNEWIDGGKIISEYVTHWTDFPELPQEYEE